MQLLDRLIQIHCSKLTRYWSSDDCALVNVAVDVVVCCHLLEITYRCYILSLQLWILLLLLTNILLSPKELLHFLQGYSRLRRLVFMCSFPAFLRTARLKRLDLRRLSFLVMTRANIFCVGWTRDHVIQTVSNNTIRTQRWLLLLLRQRIIVIIHGIISYNFDGSLIKSSVVGFEHLSLRLLLWLVMLLCCALLLMLNIYASAVAIVAWFLCQWISIQCRVRQRSRSLVVESS